MRVVQITPELASGHHVADEGSVLHRIFLSWGWESIVHPKAPSAKRGNESGPSPPPPVDRDDMLIYHFCITSPVEELIPHPPDRTIVILHERLPASLLDQYDTKTMRGIVKVDDHLKELVGGCELAIGHCTSSCDELEQLGFKRVRSLPVLVDFDMLREPADPFTLAMLDDGAVKVLYVGDLHPASGAEDLIKTAWYHGSFVGEDFRLIMAGDTESYPGYFALLADTIGNFEPPQENIVFIGELTPAQLRAYYRHADIYLHLSRSDGDGARLLHAFHFDVPVVALAQGAAPEILGDDGVLLDEPIHSAVAESIQLLLRDVSWRDTVLERQRARLDHFSKDSIAFRLRSLFSRFVIQ